MNKLGKWSFIDHRPAVELLNVTGIGERGRTIFETSWSLLFTAGTVYAIMQSISLNGRTKICTLKWNADIFHPHIFTRDAFLL